MTREKKQQLEVVKGFVDTIHQYQRATNNSLFWGSPRWGVNRSCIPLFDLTFDRCYSRGSSAYSNWADGSKDIPDTWEFEISTPDLLASVKVTAPVCYWTLWDDVVTSAKAKWKVEIAGDVSCLNDIIAWLKLNWPN